MPPSAGEPAWKHLCARQVDRLFVVGRADEPPPRERALGRRSAAGPAAGRPDSDPQADHRKAFRNRGLARRPGRRRAGSTSGAATGRRGAHGAGARPGPSVGLVLSGGGARAYAHMGAIKALQESGTPIDFVGGASMGAIIGAGVAMGWAYDEEDTRIRKAFVDTSPVDDIAFPAHRHDPGPQGATRGCRSISATSRSPTCGGRSSASRPTSPLAAMWSTGKDFCARRCAPPSPCRACCRRWCATGRCWWTAR